MKITHCSEIHNRTQSSRTYEYPDHPSFQSINEGITYQISSLHVRGHECARILGRVCRKVRCRWTVLAWEELCLERKITREGERGKQMVSSAPSARENNRRCSWARLGQISITRARWNSSNWAKFVEQSGLLRKFGIRPWTKTSKELISTALRKCFDTHLDEERESHFSLPSHPTPMFVHVLWPVEVPDPFLSWFSQIHYRCTRWPSFPHALTSRGCPAAWEHDRYARVCVEYLGSRSTSAPDHGKRTLWVANVRRLDCRRQEPFLSTTRPMVNAHNSFSIVVGKVVVQVDWCSSARATRYAEWIKHKYKCPFQDRRQ